MTSIYNPTPLDHLSMLLQALQERSRPESRGVRHLMLSDMHETWRYARQHPEALQETPPDGD